MRIGSNVGISLDSKEIGRSTLINVFFFTCVQIQACRVTLMMGHIECRQAGGIIASHLDMSGTQRRRTICVAGDDHIHRLEPGLKIGTHGRYKDQKGVLLGRAHPHLGSGSDQQRTDIQRGTRLAGRNKTLIEFHRQANSFHKQLLIGRLHLDVLTRCFHTTSIGTNPEYPDLPIPAAKSLQPLKGLLTIVQTSGCHMHHQILGGRHLQLAPGTILPDTPHIVVGPHVAERQVCPI